MIGQTKQEAFVTKWELSYQQVLAIKCHIDILGSPLPNTEANLPHREFTTRSVAEFNEAVNRSLTL